MVLSGFGMAKLGGKSFQKSIENKRKSSYDFNSQNEGVQRRSEASRGGCRGGGFGGVLIESNPAKSPGSDPRIEEASRYQAGI